ncbi:Poly polymerase [Xylaria longipes]|nr:Poly polymerase [Xylaria longipes]RYC63913.1 hypothetical protein CHU98_g2295 [Xylaria longipes]
MELIFNENHFNSVLEEIGYNKVKLPLGKLGKASLQKGFEQLKELSSLIKHGSLAKNKYDKDREEVIEEWTNKYYSTIPHVFGRGRPPLINNDDMLRREVATLDTLTDMEVANTIMNSNSKSRDATSVHKLDMHFRDLKLKELARLEHSSQEYKKIQTYLLDSKAPVNGYAFGKGVYLAGLSSKSANYCVSSLSGGVGLLMLVEAEISNPMYEIASRESSAAKKAKEKNCIATKGVGRTGPAKWKDASCVNKQLKGVMMPDDKPVDSKRDNGGYLMFNEYISYNIEHLKIRYLLKVAM